MSRLPTLRPAARRSDRIPVFALYGEPGAPGAEMLHIEAIQSRSALYAWEIEAHAHHGLHQIVWLRSGPAEVWLDEVRHQGQGPLAVVVPPGAVHAFRFAPTSDGPVLTLSPRLLVEGDVPAVADALRALFARPRLLALQSDGDDAQRIDGLMRELAAECRAPGPTGTPVPLWLARALVWRIAQIDAGTGDPDSRGRRGRQSLFTRFVALVEAHFVEHWPLSRYASRLGLTPERLNRIARAETGRNALALVHDRLAREACRQVIYIPAPISRIAFTLGFEDPAYFCRFFRRHTGCSPRAYRAAHGAAGT